MARRSRQSLYLCSTAFLRLGLPPTHAFWTDTPRPWTQRKLWWLEEDIDKSLS